MSRGSKDCSGKMQSSQFGQAEYISSLFDKLGISHGTCFEAGASFPGNISNSMPFIEKGWKTYLVEKDRQSCDKWDSLGLENSLIINAAIDYRSDGLRSIFEENNIPRDVDVLFLDIDGGEYQLLGGFLDEECRPKIICVEYDNAFPLSIDYIPKTICRGRQASSISFYKMMTSAGYLYTYTFFHDHVFVDKAFAKQYNLTKFPGFNQFCQVATMNLYQFDNVFLCQDLDSADLGVKFFERKLNVLISEGHPSASHYYSYIAGGIMNCIGFMKKIGKDSEEYAKDFNSAAIKFIDDYHYVLQGSD